MRFLPLSFLGAAALALSACVVVPVDSIAPPPNTGVPVPGTQPVVSQLQSQLNNISIRSDIFAGRLQSNGLIEGGHDVYGRGGSWSVNGSTLCLNFANRVSECGFAEFRGGALLHQAGNRGGEAYDFQY